MHAMITFGSRLLVGAVVAVGVGRVASAIILLFFFFLELEGKDNTFNFTCSTWTKTRNFIYFSQSRPFDTEILYKCLKTLLT